MTEYDLDYGEAIKKNNLVGRKFLYKDNNGVSLQEITIFYVNKNLYYFSYLEENGLNKVDKDYFFNSISFSDNHKLIQYPEKKMSSLQKLIISLLGLLFISFLLRTNTKRN